jgi:hypothetical protein
MGIESDLAERAIMAKRITGETSPFFTSSTKLGLWNRE